MKRQTPTITVQPSVANFKFLRKLKRKRGEVTRTVNKALDVLRTNPAHQKAGAQ